MRVAIGATLITASGITALWVREGSSFGVGNPLTLAVLTAAFALSWLYPLLTLWKEETVAFSLDEALFVVAALLLPPLGVLLAFS
ncbi:MAG: hypothetical protein ACRD1T_17425, partial [Acidimicrobiia bacterium]